MTLVVVALVGLTLEKVVFNIMGGIDPKQRSVNDDAYGFLFLISLGSVCAFVPLLLSYLIIGAQSLRPGVSGKKAREITEPRRE